MEARDRDLSRTSMRQFAQDRIPACLKPDPDPATLRSAIEQMAAKDRWVYLESSEATWSPDLTSMLPNVQVPVLILWGEHDTVTPRELSEELHRGIRGSELRVIPDAGHISNLDNPSAFNAAVREFLESVDVHRTEGDVI